MRGFDEMGSRADEMIRVAVRSFAERDAERAETLVHLDELIDRARTVASCSGCSRSAATPTGGNGAFG